MTVIRGGRHGSRESGHAVFASAPDFPASSWRAAVPAGRLRCSSSRGTTRLDLAIGILGADRLEESVFVVQGSRRGAFAADETRVWPLFQRPIDAVPNGGIKRMRLGRVDGA